MNIKPYLSSNQNNVGQKLKAFDVELIRGEHGSGSGGFG
jgi:hypothetical protein